MGHGDRIRGCPESEVGDLLCSYARVRRGGRSGLYGRLESFCSGVTYCRCLARRASALRRGPPARAIGAQAGFVEEADGKAIAHEEQQPAGIMDVRIRNG